MRIRFQAFRLLAVVFVCAAAYHAIAAVDGDVGRARHLVFVGINACLAALILRRPPGFVLVFALLCGQQMVSHGEGLARSLREGRIDWASIGVLLVMPSTLALLAFDARARRRSRIR